MKPMLLNPVQKPITLQSNIREIAHLQFLERLEQAARRRRRFNRIASVVGVVFFATMIYWICTLAFRAWVMADLGKTYISRLD